MDQSHRGARAPSPFNQSGDRRILELDEALRGVEAMTGAFPGLGLSRDSTRAKAAQQQSLGGNQGHFSRGTVIHALPVVNWYKVQVGDGAGWVAACDLVSGTLMPLGPRDIAMVGPNDSVLLFKPRGLNYAFIIGVIPPFAVEGSILVPDWIVQGGGSGLKREDGHKYPIKSLYKGGGVIDWSAQRPQDQSGAEKGWMTPFGLAVTIDDYLIQVRVNEMAGLWMTLFDGWVRLAGEQLLIESSIHEQDAGDDEGESRHFIGVSTYPHEALGQYASNQTFTEDSSDKDVQYTKHKGKVDLKAGEEDLAPIYRYQEYAGYLGQGHLRLVMKPAKDSGSHTYRNPGDDVGLFMESIGLNGTYSLVAAASVHIGKRCRIVQPVLKMPAQSKAGDDAESDNYKFSSLFGSGADHKVGTVGVQGQVKSILRVSGVEDLIAYDVNWRALHPFHYHKADYKTPQASDGTDLKKVQESVDFSAASSNFYVADPVAKSLKIDHRYGNVDYFERESFIHFHDDGSVQICGGAGEEIVMAGGRIFLNAPAGIDVRPATDFTVSAAQIVLKAKESVDVSSTNADVRLKAEVNMQFTSGNSGRGSMLLDAKGEGSIQDYENKFGEDVRGSGLVLRTTNGQAAILAKDIYLRTGGNDLGEGDIVLDASRGKRRVQVFGNEFNAYVNGGITFNFGPLEDSSSVRRSYYFSESTMIADAKLLLGGKLIGYNGGGGSPGIVVDGGVYGTESFATAGVMADRKGMFLGKVGGGFSGIIQAACAAAQSAANDIRQRAETMHSSTIVEKFYQPEQIGNDGLIKLIKFSFRDPPGSPSQYKTSQFQWPEARWQQFVRFGLGTGGTGWTEKPVLYQGQETYPWPGKAKWKDEPTLLQLSELTMFDAGNGVDKDRPGPYESPKLGTLTPVTLDGTYKLLR